MNSAPEQRMAFGWLPKELLIRCDALVAAHHRTHGDSLPKILCHRDTMVFIGAHSDLLTLLGSASAAGKFALTAGGAAALTLVAAAIVNWWIALVAAPLVFATFRFRKHESASYRLIAAIILAIEMMAADFAGWGCRSPDLMQLARVALENYLPTDRTRLLDIYLPRRSTLDPAALTAFGPPT